MTEQRKELFSKTNTVIVDVQYLISLFTKVNKYSTLVDLITKYVVELFKNRPNLLNVFLAGSMSNNCDFFKQTDAVPYDSFCDTIADSMYVACDKDCRVLLDCYPLAYTRIFGQVIQNLSLLIPAKVNRVISTLFPLEPDVPNMLWILNKNSIPLTWKQSVCAEFQHAVDSISVQICYVLANYSTNDTVEIHTNDHDTMLACRLLKSHIFIYNKDGLTKIMNGSPIFDSPHTVNRNGDIVVEIRPADVSLDLFWLPSGHIAPTNLTTHQLNTLLQIDSSIRLKKGPEIDTETVDIVQDIRDHRIRYVALVPDNDPLKRAISAAALVYKFARWNRMTHNDNVVVISALSLNQESGELTCRDIKALTTLFSSLSLPHKDNQQLVMFALAKRIKIINHTKLPAVKPFPSIFFSGVKVGLYTKNEQPSDVIKSIALNYADKMIFLNRFDRDWIVYLKGESSNACLSFLLVFAKLTHPKIIKKSFHNPHPDDADLRFYYPLQIEIVGWPLKRRLTDDEMLINAFTTGKQVNRYEPCDYDDPSMCTGRECYTRDQIEKLKEKHTIVGSNKALSYVAEINEYAFYMTRDIPNTVAKFPWRNIYHEAWIGLLEWKLTTTTTETASTNIEPTIAALNRKWHHSWIAALYCYKTGQNSIDKPEYDPKTFYRILYDNESRLETLCRVLPVTLDCSIKVAITRGEIAVYFTSPDINYKTYIHHAYTAANIDPTTTTSLTFNIDGQAQIPLRYYGGHGGRFPPPLPPSLSVSPSSLF